jgi:SAM-dependent methyltransferase
LNPVSDAGSAALAQFQVQGNAAERYERWVVPFVVGPWVPGLLDLAALRPGERVLDIATGTGVVARLAARRVSPGGAVTGLDLNRAMLAEARRLPLPPGLEVTWQQGSALDLPFHDGAFDVVVSQQGLQFFLDRSKGLGEMRRVLTPGGRVAVSVWTGPSPYFHCDARWAGAIREPGGCDQWCGRLLARRCGPTPRPSHGCRLPRGRRSPPPHDTSAPGARGVRSEAPVRRPGSRPRCCGRNRGPRGASGPYDGSHPSICRHVDGYGLAVPQEVNVATGST